MNSFESSVRTKYWGKYLQEVAHDHPALPVLFLFVLAIVGIVVCRSTVATVFIFIMAVSFAGTLSKRRPAQASVPPPVQNMPFTGNPDLTRILTSLGEIEARIARLESTMTSKEYDWEQRLRTETENKPTAS